MDREDGLVPKKILLQSKKKKVKESYKQKYMGDWSFFLMGWTSVVKTDPYKLFIVEHTFLSM